MRFLKFCAQVLLIEFINYVKNGKNCESISTCTLLCIKVATPRNIFYNEIFNIVSTLMYLVYK